MIITTRHAWPLILVLVLAASLAAGTSRAEPPTGQQKKAATAHFKRGKAFFDEGLYDKAIAEYQLAYDVVRWPGFLFNIGLAYEAKKDLPKALANYQRYLELDPKGEASDEAAAYVAKLTPIVERLEAERARERARVEEEARRRKAAEAAEKKRQAALAEAAAERERRARERARRQKAQEKQSRLLRIGGWALLGAGAVSLAVGAKYGADAHSASNALSDHTSGDWTDALLARQEEGKTAETRMIVFTAVGAGVVAVGGVLYLWGRWTDPDRTEAHPASVAVQPSISPTEATVSLVGRF